MAAAEFKHARRRTNSNAIPTIKRNHAPGDSEADNRFKSSHTSDEFLKDFLSPTFDAASFLNATLPPLRQQRQVTAQSGSEAVPLAELSTKTQALLSQLNSHTTRLSNTLTQLTDDILRSGSRLAYEVELLRGETVSLNETMQETLQDDIKNFLPNGLGDRTSEVNGSSTLEEAHARRKSVIDAAPATTDTSPEDPAFIKQLQTLTLVRSRLESVVKTFGDAMEFVFPPSELSVSSSFLSVSAPEPGSAQQSSEEKGQQVLKTLREEINHLLYKSEEDPVTGIEKAASRIEELKTLTTIWNGTAEEKGRNKFIESLAKTVEDRHRELTRELEQRAKREGGSSRRTGVAGGEGGATAGDDAAKSVPGGFGLLGQLQRLRSGL